MTHQHPSLRGASAAWLELGLALLIAVPASAQKPDDGVVADRIARVEANLLPSVRVQGRDYKPAGISDRMRYYGVPAVSVAVIHDGEFEWARAYGWADVEARRPATTSTLFQAASMSKPLAATAALHLVQSGVLALDEDVNRKLTSWKVLTHGFGAQHPVTLRGLLTHTAGLTVNGFPGYEEGERIPTVVQVLSGEPPANTGPVRVDLEPGSTWRYSGGGTTVMQLLLSDVTGQPFPELMRARVLEPFGMHASTYRQPLPVDRHGDAATGYRAGLRPIRGHFHTYPEMAAAGLWTTPSDLARWILGVQEAFAGGSQRVISRETAAAMLTPGLGGWGLGPAIEGAGDSLRFSHGGANAGFRGTFLGFTNRGDGVVVMTNSDSGGTIATEIVQAVAREYGWTGLAPHHIVPVSLPPEILSRLAGRYATAGARPTEVSIRIDGGVPIFVAPDSSAVELVPTGEDSFALASSGTPLRVERDAAGSVVALVVGTVRLERLP
jgi:CubicO group peptidase (beta-lactamase class C family)